jgi:hypothetical protein
MRNWLCVALLLIKPLGAAAGDWAACRAAVGAAEREAALPQGLLHAIARIESGRRDPATGRIEPWPWALNAAGMGLHAATRAEAVATVAALQARGIRSIDVGCLQVNLLHHPDAFASLEEAFEPLANARYAARFLQELQARAGGAWSQAVAWYHSATPGRGEAYRLRVMAALAGNEAEPRGAAAPPAAERIVRMRADRAVQMHAQPFVRLHMPGVAPLLSSSASRVSVFVPLLPGAAQPEAHHRPLPTPAARPLPRVVRPHGVHAEKLP